MKSPPSARKGTTPFRTIPAGLLSYEKGYGGARCIPVHKASYPLFILAEIEVFVNTKIYSFI